MNADRFGAIPANMDLVVVIQVHNRPKYLDKLIQSLRAAKQIDRSLLIFSHDFYSSEINDMVRNIEFTRVKKIFFGFVFFLSRGGGEPFV